LIEKENMFHSRGKLKNERRTSNIERPTSNKVFCQLKKTEQRESTLRNSIPLLSTGSSPELAKVSQSAVSSGLNGLSQPAVGLFKIDKAYAIACTFPDT
jgi:hypothetical protein